MEFSVAGGFCGAARHASHSIGAPPVISGRSLSVAQRIGASGLDWIVPDWPGAHCGRAAGSTRKRTDDNDEAVAQNRRRLRAFLPAEPRWLHQVHGAVVAVHGPQDDGVAAVADAAVTREPGVVCAVLSADCLPVLLADRRGNVVGVAHAGWRGLAAGVLERTVAEMKDLGANSDQLVAWLGPAIGPAAFEVGADVLEAFRATGRYAD